MARLKAERGYDRRKKEDHLQKKGRVPIKTLVD
jgi:hypothetical protein